MTRDDVEISIPNGVMGMVLNLESGNVYRRNSLLRQMVESHYERNDMELRPGTFRVRGDTLEVIPAYQDKFGYKLSKEGGIFHSLQFVLTKSKL